MKPIAIASVSAFTLLLAACGDDQTAQQNGEPVEGDTASMEERADPAPVPDPGAPPGDVAEEPARPNMGNPVMPGNAEDAGIAATETPPIQPEADPDARLLAEEETGEPDAGETGSIPDQAGVSIEPGIYETGNATMQIEPDGSYVIEMDAQGADRAEIDRLEGNVLAAAPMTETPADEGANCLFSNEAGGLRVTAADPSCAFLDGEVFSRVE